MFYFAYRLPLWNPDAPVMASLLLSVCSSFRVQYHYLGCFSQRGTSNVLNKSSKTKWDTLRLNVHAKGVKKRWHTPICHKFYLWVLFAPTILRI